MPMLTESRRTYLLEQLSIIAASWEALPVEVRGAWPQAVGPEASLYGQAQWLGAVLEDMLHNHVTVTPDLVPTMPTKTLRERFRDIVKLGGSRG